MAVTETESKIRTTSQGLFVTALRTIPLTPIYAEMIFLADGLDTPSADDEETLKNFLKDCTMKGIVPFSVTKMEMRDGNIVRSESFMNPPRNDTPQVFLNDAFLSRFDRRREQKIHLEFDQRSRYGSYDAIKDRYLDQFLARGYGVHHADLWLNSYHLSGYNDGDYAATQVVLGNWISHGIELNRSPDDSSFEDLEKLEKWFNSLKQLNKESELLQVSQ